MKLEKTNHSYCFDLHTDTSKVTISRSHAQELQQCVVGVLRGAGPMFAQVGDIGIYFEEVGPGRYTVQAIGKGLATDVLSGTNKQLQKLWLMLDEAP
jgi:hypothetical protein